MKLIDKHNFLHMVCTSYTLISLSIIFIESIIKGRIEPSQLNVVASFVLTVLSVFILSQQYRFDRLPLAVVILGQYFLGVVIVEGSIWLMSHRVDVHPNGYRDMFWSFSVPYMIGAVIYYVKLIREIKAQNQMIKAIKEHENFRQEE